MEEEQKTDIENLEERNEGDEQEVEEIGESQYQLSLEHDDGADEDRERDREEEKDEELKQPKKRCKRKRRVKSICLEYDDEEEGEEGEEEENEEYDDSCYEDISGGTSILSALTFQWENQTYEFDELCDPGTIANIFNRYNYMQEDYIDDIGRLRYERLCKMLVVPPILRFMKGLTTKEIDLSFRGIDGKNLRAMFAALETNTFVKKLVLKYNKLSKDDCFCLGRTLNVNDTITALDLTGCRIGPEGVGYLVMFLATNESLTQLNLSKCDIEDDGMTTLAHVLLRNNSIENLDLSYNKLKEAADSLAMALKVNKAITTLNLCYNNFFDPLAMKEFFRSMASNNTVNYLNVAWNGFRGVDVGTFIGNFLRRNRAVTFLDLSNNRLEGAAISEIRNALSRSRVKTLKLGRNPMSPEDLDALLTGAKSSSYLTTLDLEDLWVKKSFIKILKKIQQERDFEVIIGGVYEDYEIFGPDFATILLRRANFEAAKPKSVKMKKDFGHLIWTLGEDALPEEDFMAKVKKFKAKVSDELITQLMNTFMIPKIKLIDVIAMKNKYLMLFPDSTPPPPPIVKAKEKLGEWDEDVEEVEGTDFTTAVSAYADNSEQSIHEGEPIAKEAKVEEGKQVTKGIKAEESEPAAEETKAEDRVIKSEE